MKEKTTKLIDHLEQGNLELFRKGILGIISSKIEESILQKRSSMTSSMLEAINPDVMKAEAEKQSLYVDPMMAKEFFLFDLEHKGHTITIKSLGTGIGKPLVSYIDGERFEIFTDKEVATKESKQAVERMVKRRITKIGDLRKTDQQIKDEEKARKEEEKQAKMLAAKEASKDTTK